MSSKEFTHFDQSGASRMVDVSDKQVTQRIARASGSVQMRAETIDRIRDRTVTKGEVLEVARLAGIMAAKRTGELIPLCHPLPVDSACLSLVFSDPTTLQIEATIQTTARTGVEMEAMVAVSVAALTVYDMCKSLDRDITLGPIRLEEKSGGRSGHYLRKDEE